MVGPKGARAQHAKALAQRGPAYDLDFRRIATLSEIESRGSLAQGRVAASAQAGPAAAALAAAGGRAHLGVAERALARAGRAQLGQRAIEALLQREPARARRLTRAAPQEGQGSCLKRRAHGTCRHRPTTLPSTWTSRLRIGSRAAFSGCRRTWSCSRKKRFTVASSPTSATTISP